MVDTKSTTRLSRARNWLGLSPNIVVILVALLLIGSGEALWREFLPKYLQFLGATVWVISAYGSLTRLLHITYQYPAGWLSDWLGRRRVLALLTSMAIVAYTIYLFSPSWQWVIFGTLFVGVSWQSLTLPGTFAAIGDSLRNNRRDIGFGLHALLERASVVVMAPLGGWLITGGVDFVDQGGGGQGKQAAHDLSTSGPFGLADGMRLGFGITIVFALLALVIILLYYVENAPRAPSRPRFIFVDVWRGMETHLKRLLVADSLVSWAEWMTKVFVVLYVTNVFGASIFAFGVVLSAEALVELLLYIPGAKLSERLGRPPFILARYGFWTFFFLVLASAPSFFWVALAFGIKGLRQIGEPARRALLVSQARETARGRVVGTYHLIQSLALLPASLIGGWLWTINQELLFYTAFLVGATGFLAYALWVRTEKSLAYKSSNQCFYGEED